ncbi:MAG: hypothetical protein JXN60_06925 [Lentisphaerae bacterium]|nr:hypothetical protein [Lentisphaerota bacterium]
MQRVVIVLIGIVAFFVLICGCATTNESDIPWNHPENWEGSPAIPGFDQY